MQSGKELFTPNQSADPSPIMPTYRMKEEKGITVVAKKVTSS